MIRVELQPEPDDFHVKVRIPGQRCIRERTGRVAVGELKRTSGQAFKKTADDPEDIKSKDFMPYWREATDQLMDGYDRICAFSCFYVHRITGNPTVDHMMPKSKASDQVYEWNNYRFACGLMNTRKSTCEGLDPFEVEDDWFELDLADFQVIQGRGCPQWLKDQWVELIEEQFKLNGAEFLTRRREEAEDFWLGDGSERTRQKFFERSPFLAREIERQGFLAAPPYSISSPLL